MEKCTKSTPEKHQSFLQLLFAHFFSLKMGKFGTLWRGVPAREPVGTTKPKFCGSPGEGPKNEGGEQCEKV